MPFGADRAASLSRRQLSRGNGWVFTMRVFGIGLAAGVVVLALAMFHNDTSTNGRGGHPAPSMGAILGGAKISMTAQDQPGVANDDCQIFALLGREILGWGKVEPDIAQFAIFYRPQGDGFVEQCPWSALGVVPLKAARPDPDNMRFFTAPKYSADRNGATVSFVTRLVGRNPDGSARPPFISQEELSLAKIDGRWHLVGRNQGAIT